MKEYHYHPEYKYFLYSANAHSSPREPGKYLISANATTIEPPEKQEGFVLIFDGDSWMLTLDKRGLYYCKDTLRQQKIEDPLFNVDNLTLETPPFEQKLDNQKIKWCYDTEKWIIEDLPEPEILNPKPIENTNSFEGLSAEQKLNAIGLTVEDLRALLE